MEVNEVVCKKQTVSLTQHDIKQAIAEYVSKGLLNQPDPIETQLSITVHRETGEPQHGRIEFLRPVLSK